MAACRTGSEDSPIYNIAIIPHATIEYAVRSLIGFMDMRVLLQMVSFQSLDKRCPIRLTVQALGFLAAAGQAERRYSLQRRASHPVNFGACTPYMYAYLQGFVYTADCSQAQPSTASSFSADIPFHRSPAPVLREEYS